MAAVLLAVVNLASIAIDSMLAVMMPNIVFDLDVRGLGWVLAGPAIGAAAIVLSAGQLYAVYPFKIVYMFFGSILLLGTISPGFASSMPFFFFTRIAVGIGLGGQQFGALVFLERDGTFTDKIRRDFFLSFSTILGFILGPIYGSLFAHDHKVWSWAFYVAFVILVSLLLVLVYLLPNKLDIVATAPWTYGGALRQNGLARFDIVGFVFSFVGILLLFVPFNIAGSKVPWRSGYLYIPIGIGGLLIIITIVQQLFKIFTSTSTRLFPTHYLGHFKPTMLFMLAFLTAGIFQTTLAYSAIYQLLTRETPSATRTAFYLFFSLTGPHLIPVLLIPLYIGGGLIATHPLLPSYSVWSVGSSLFLVMGTALLFVNTSSFFPDTGGLPIVAVQFALACIGFWSAVILTIVHHIMDLYQPASGPDPRQKHPHHNRAFILFAIYLGAATALTIAGSVLMNLGPRAMLSILEAFQGQTPIPATEIEALTIFLGFSFIQDGTTASMFSFIIADLKHSFAWSFLVELAFAVFACLVGACLVGYKFWKGESPFRNRTTGGIPREWLVAGRGHGNRDEQTGGDAQGQGVELESREGAVSSATHRMRDGGEERFSERSTAVEDGGAERL
jgi:MFS family permease